MTHDFEHKLVQVKWSDMPEMARINYICMEKQTDMFQPPLQRSFEDEHDNTTHFH
jgi:hypothetical protein